MVKTTSCRHFIFEIAVGMNGVIWINAAELRTMVLIRNAFLNASSLDDYHMLALIEKLAPKVTIKK